MNDNLTFKEITQREELEACFRFRYEIFSKSDNNLFLKENGNHIDLDSFDVHSKHYALTSGNSMAGYLRIVFPKKELFNYEVLDIGEQYELLSRQECFRQDDSAPFPFLSYQSVPASHLSYFNNLTVKGEQVVEVSRLTIHPAYRSIRTSKFMMDCAIALYKVYGVRRKHVIISCYKHHAKFYQGYGYQLIDDVYVLHGIPNVTLTLPLVRSIDDSAIPECFHDKMRMMAEAFQLNGSIELSGDACKKAVAGQLVC